MPTVADLISCLETIAPPELAASWDNVGLLLGDRSSPVDRVLTCLTLTPDVAAEALAGGYHAIVTHHPILFRGVKRITSDTPEGESILGLARARIAVYSPHTGFDDAPGGINDLLCDRLGVGERRPLRLRESPGKYKVVVFVPQADLASVSDAMFAAGAGRIGEYRECSFRIPGTGTFHGSEAANPSVGQKGRREEVEEMRLEMVCPHGRLGAVLEAMRRAHSYEEPAVDVYPLFDACRVQGAGRIGSLNAGTSLGEMGRRLRVALDCGRLQIVGEPERTVRQVAVACGAAGEMLADAIRAGADLFVTGEMRFHDYLAARSAGIAVLLPGHYFSERFAMLELAERISRQMPGIATSASQSEREPVSWL